MTSKKITHSRGQSFKKCRRLHWYEYELGLRKITDAKPLRMGSAGHEALEVLKSGGTLPEAIHEIDLLYLHCPDSVPGDEWRIEQETIDTLIAGYEWRWGRDGFEVLANEQAFSIPLRNPETNYPTPNFTHNGKIDGIVELPDGRRAVLEHKFIGEDISADSEYRRRLQIDGQTSGYLHAARVEGYEVDTVLYDLIRKPTIRPNAIPLLDDDGLKIVLDSVGDRVQLKSGKPRQTGDKEKGYILQTRDMTPEEWSQKLIDDIAKRPEWYYQRVEIARLDSDIDEYRQEMWDLQRDIREAELNGRHYRNTSPFTCNFCSYFGICSSRIEAGEVPDGFQILDDPHPELNEVSK